MKCTFLVLAAGDKGSITCAKTAAKQMCDNLCIISFFLLILSQLNSVLPKLCYHLQDFLQLLNMPGESIFLLMVPISQEPFVTITH